MADLEKKNNSAQRLKTNQKTQKLLFPSENKNISESVEKGINILRLHDFPSAALIKTDLQSEK